MAKKLLSSFLVMLLLVVSGCSKSTGENASDSNFKIGVVADKSGIDDKSFNQSTWEGVQEFAKENNLVEETNYKVLESSNGESDYIPNLTSFADSGYSLVFAVGNTMDTSVEEVAAQYPTTNFALIDAVVSADNVASITFKEQEGSFLAGVAAAMTTKSDKVGFIGGMESDLIKKFEVGFIAGVHSVNPDIEVLSQYAGAFDKPDKGQSIASSMYGQGVDVIYQAAGSTGNGVFTEAKSQTKNGTQVWDIGVDRDQYEEGLPENVTLTSMVKKVDVAVKEVAKEAMNNNFPAGQTLEYGIEEDGVGLSENTENLSDKAITAIEEYTQKIKNGDIKVPSTEAELKAFK